MPNPDASHDVQGVLWFVSPAPGEPAVPHRGHSLAPDAQAARRQAVIDKLEADLDGSVMDRYGAPDIADLVLGMLGLSS